MSDPLYDDQKCGSTRRGHWVHPIQARLALRDQWAMLSFEAPDHAHLVSVASTPELGACTREHDGGVLTRPGADQDPPRVATQIAHALWGEAQRAGP